MRSFDRLGANGWTGGAYSAFRLAFGVYLFVHFAMLLPYAAELFSSEGMLPNAELSPLFGVLPNPLWTLDTPAAVQAWIAIGAALAVPFAVGFADRWAALGLWFVLACVFARNPLIANPSLPYVGWLLLAHAILPTSPRGSLDARRNPQAAEGWRMPPAVFAAAWIVMAVGYTYSGWTKLDSPSWLDGSALSHVLANPLARPTELREWLLALPDPWLRLATWSGLGLELGFVVLAVFRRTRPFAWAAMLSMHVALIALIDFADLSLGMVVLHGFTFDPGWVSHQWRANAARRLRAVGSAWVESLPATGSIWGASAPTFSER